MDETSGFAFLKTLYSIEEEDPSMFKKRRLNDEGNAAYDEILKLLKEYENKDQNIITNQAHIFAAQNETVPQGEAPQFNSLYAESTFNTTCGQSINATYESAMDVDNITPLINYNGCFKIKEEENYSMPARSPVSKQNSMKTVDSKFRAVESIENVTCSDGLVSLSNKVEINPFKNEWSSMSQELTVNPCLIKNEDMTQIEKPSPVESSMDGRAVEWSKLQPTLGFNSMEIDRDGDSPLHIYVAQCNEGGDNSAKAATLREKRGAYQRFVNIQNHSGETPLHLAVVIGDKDIVRVLMEFGAHINVYDKHLSSPLHVILQPKRSIHRHPLNVVKEIIGLMLGLCNEKIDWTVKNGKGLSTVHLAAERKDLDLVKMLCMSGANIDEKEEKGGLTPLMMVIERAKSEMDAHAKELWLALAKLLITQLKADVNITSFSEDTPLHLACTCNHKSLVEVLLDNGADVNVKNVYKKTEKDLTNCQQIKDILEVKYRQKRRKRKNDSH